MTVRGTIHFHTSVFELSIVTLSRFFTVSTLITMVFSLSTYCEQILLFYMFLIWLKRDPERGWTKKNRQKYFWYIFVQIECKIKHTMMSIHFFVLISVSRRSRRSRPAPPLHIQNWTLRVIT